MRNEILSGATPKPPLGVIVTVTPEPQPRVPVRITIELSEEKAKELHADLGKSNNVKTYPIYVHLDSALRTAGALK